MAKTTAIKKLRSKAGIPKIKPPAKTGHHLMARDVSDEVYETFHSLPHGARQAVLHKLLEAGCLAAKSDALWHEKLLKGDLSLKGKRVHSARN